MFAKSKYNVKLILSKEYFYKNYFIKRYIIYED